MNKKLNPFPPAYLRPEVAAAHVGVSRRQLEVWVSEGRIRQPYRPSSQIVLFARDRLEADVARICGIITNEITQEKINPWDELT